MLVEFWATWCPPCHSTLRWLARLKERHGERVAVIALAVQSEEAEVREVAGRMGPSVVWAMATPEAARAFGDVSAVPALFVFGPDGAAAATFFGARPELEREAEAALTGLLR